MVEYTLLILVVVLIINGLFKILNERLIDGPNSLQNSYLGAYQKMFTGHNASFQGQYKNFTIRR
ncbi:MAG: hypothetical protein CME66_12880 [Halobacteriovoraceae bacterium]|nr:hypothetical protein [Halobacteriovoraceae bacterium]